MPGKNDLRLATKARSFDMMGFIWSRSQFDSFLNWKEDLALVWTPSFGIRCWMQTSVKTGIRLPNMISSSKDFRQSSSILVGRSGLGPHRGVKSRIVPWTCSIGRNAVSGRMMKTEYIDQQFEAQLLKYIIHTPFHARRFQGLRRGRRKGGSLASKYNSVQWEAATSGA